MERAECHGRVDGADGKVATATSPWLIQKGYCTTYELYRGCDVVHCPARSHTVPALRTSCVVTIRNQKRNHLTTLLITELETVMVR